MILTIHSSLRRSVLEFCGHIAGLVALGMLLQEVGEEKQLEHHEDDKQLDQYDGPERLAKAHRPETVVVEVKSAVEEASLIHRCYCFIAANIMYFHLTSK